MNIYFPKNLFSSIFAMQLKKEYLTELKIVDSAAVTKNIIEDDNAVGLIPLMDLVQHNDLFVSKKFGIAFNGLLSNSYLYFIPENKTVDKLNLYGDLSANEILLNKIIFSEHFHSQPEIQLMLEKPEIGKKNYCITGALNFDLGIFENGVPLSDQIVDLIQLPFVEFVIASKNKETVEKFNASLELISLDIDKNLDSLLESFDLPQNSFKFIHENFDSFKFNFGEDEISGMIELLRLPYYHGVKDEIKEINFV